ncbi:transcriptional regulator, LysR family [Thiorhodococcus drewsii AZ1]|uniref:Transcriptional regulator, LysR family n=1 Tax=Thiorhodococcus drewsii AZ1 TaxID=765913 RepID=G2DZ33_9GAMM|nr:LysR family transcriptional regulator [Thiorhodococcus drewsii]EGV32387.1 transcriptional regulator, LysR family [Thiorhodococcus drewsii AZ1]
MDSKLLKCFLHVLDAGGLTSASERLHLTQSALSRQLKQLESDLGVALFQRTGRGLIPTETGRQLERRARPLMAELERLAADIASDRQGVTGALALAVPPSVGVAAPANLIRRYRDLYPQVRLRVVSALSGAIQDGLLRGRLDLGLVHHPLTSAGLLHETLWRERLWLVAESAAGLDPETPVPLGEALAGPLVLTGSRHGLRVLVEGQAAGLGLALDVTVEVDSLRIMLETVALGLGRTLLPYRAIEAELASGRLCAAPVISPEVERVTVLAWPADRALSRAAEAMAELIRAELRHP